MKSRAYSNSHPGRLAEIANLYNTTVNINDLFDFIFVLTELSREQTEELTEILHTVFSSSGFQYLSSKRGMIFTLPAKGITISQAVTDPHLKSFFEKYTRINSATSEVWDINGKKLDFNHPALIMGILNITPDSFSDGGLFTDTPKAVDRALEMVEQGASIIDIGGESTRPGSLPVKESIELERVLPVIEGIKKESAVIISIDTYKSSVAEAAIAAGADLINDISGATFDDDMMSLTARRNCPLIIMHILGTPRNMQKNPAYKNVVEEIYYYFENRLREADKYNIKKIIIDPGIGFGKCINDNLKLIRDLGDFLWLEKPLLIGTSRKSFIGKLLNQEVDKRLTGSLATSLIAMQNGAKILRVHDVKEIAGMVNLVNEIYYCE